MQFLLAQLNDFFNCLLIKGGGHCVLFGFGGPKLLALAACLITALIALLVGVKRIAAARRRKRRVEFEGSALW